MKKYLPAFFLPLGCIGITSGFQLISVIIALGNYFKYNIKYNVKEFMNNKYVRISFLLMCLWAFSISLSDFLFYKEFVHIKEGWNYFQRFFPFIIIGLIFVNDKRFFKYFIYGLLLSLIIINSNVFYNFYVQGHWRPSTMFGNPNKLGGFLILVLPFIINSVFYFEKILVKYLIGSICFFTILSLIISGSRGAMLGIIVGYFILLIFILLKKYEMKKILCLTSLLFVSFLVLIFIINQYFPYMVHRNYDMERIYLWQAAAQMFKDNILLGVGAGNFNYNYVNYYMNPLATNIHLTSPHNIFLHYFSQRGIIVGIPFVLLFLYQIYSLTKNLFIQNGNINYFVAAGFVSVLGMGVHGLFDTQITMRDYALMYWLLYSFSCCSFIYIEGENKLC